MFCSFDMGLVEGGGGGGNQVFSERRRDTSEWNHPLLGPNLLFCFPFPPLLETPEAVDTAWLWLPACVLYGLGAFTRRPPGAKVTDIIQNITWCGWKSGRRPRGSASRCWTCSWRIGPGSGVQTKDPLAYYIAFYCLFLYFIVNWIYSEKIILC